MAAVCAAVPVLAHKGGKLNSYCTLLLGWRRYCPPFIRRESAGMPAGSGRHHFLRRHGFLTWLPVHCCSHMQSVSGSSAASQAILT